MSEVTLNPLECALNEAQALRRQVDALQAENAKLRKLGEQYETVLADYRSEVAKMRKLVSWMYEHMDESCAVQHPYAPAPISYDRLMQARARARELGVEVD